MLINTKHKEKIDRINFLTFQAKKNLHQKMKVLKKAATYSSTVVVPSAQTGLTSLFGKVRGEPRRYNHLSFMTFQN